MAHIPDAVLSLPVLAGGGALAAGGVAWGLHELEERRIPLVAILAAAFFAVSLVAIPAGPSSVHLLLAGLMGLLIGPATFPAVLVGLLLQALLFGSGGLSTLGVNTLDIALPGVVAGLLAGPALARLPAGRAGILASVAAALAVAGTGGLVVLALVLSSAEYVPSARIILLTYLPLMLGEAAVTGFAVMFLKRARPDLFGSGRPPAPA
jgi:cobalt/nickel transport system permease protein